MSPSQPRSSERGTPLVLEDSSHWRNCAQLHWSPSTSDPTKTKQVSEDEFPPFPLGVFQSHIFPQLFRGQVPRCPPRCQGTSCQTHMAGHSFWHGGMVPSEPPNGRSQERPWLKKTQRYPRTHSWLMTGDLGPKTWELTSFLFWSLQKVCISTILTEFETCFLLIPQILMFFLNGPFGDFISCNLFYRVIGISWQIKSTYSDLNGNQEPEMNLVWDTQPTYQI